MKTRVLLLFLVLNFGIPVLPTTTDDSVVKDVNSFNSSVFTEETLKAVQDEASQSSEQGYNKPACKPMRFPPPEYLLIEDQVFIPAINESFTNFTVSDDSEAHVCYPLTTQFRNCTTWGLFQEEFTVLPNYRLLVSSYNREYDIGQYLMSDNSEKIAYVCVPDDEPDHEGGFGEIYVKYFYPAFWIVSCIFLVITAIIIYSSKPKLSLTVKVQLCHIVSITAAYVFLIIHRFATRSLSSDSVFCIFQAVNIHWWFLAAFAWLNVLAFHIWLNVADRDAGPTHSLRSTRFTLYSVYAWMTPTLIAAVPLVLDLFYTEQESPLRPRYAAACWFNNTNSLVAFFYGPLALFILINIIFFILTVYQLQKKAQDSALNTKGQVSLILVYVRLQVIMGLWWILEVVSWAFADYKNLTYVLDTVTSLQGVFIFLAYQAHHNLWYYINHRSCIPPSSDHDVVSQNSDIPPEHNYTHNLTQSGLLETKDKYKALP